MGVREGTREKELENQEAKKDDEEKSEGTTSMVNGETKGTPEVEKIKVTEYFIKFKNL